MESLTSIDARNGEEWNSGQWCQTFTSKRFYPLEPERNEYDIVDIAHQLSLKCRFSGACSVFYSVAEHSCRVAEILPDEFKLAGLLHDSSEQQLPDCCRPIKSAVMLQCPDGLHSFRDIEDRMLACIAKTFGFQFPLPKEVKAADWKLLATEARDLMGTTLNWDLNVEPLPDKIYPWNWKYAECRFLQMFNQLVKK